MPHDGESLSESLREAEMQEAPGVPSASCEIPFESVKLGDCGSLFAAAARQEQTHCHEDEGRDGTGGI